MDGARALTAAVVKDGQRFVARCLEVEVASQGGSVDEALSNLCQALELYFEDVDLPSTVEHPLITAIEIRIRA